MIWIVFESIYGGMPVVISAYTSEEKAQEAAQYLLDHRENFYSHDYWVETVPLDLETF